MEVFRIARRKYAEDLSGEGAKLFGGRWNEVGFACIYTSTSVALCLCEYLVNLPTYLLPSDLQLISYEIHGDRIHQVEENTLPKNWNTIPVSNVSQKFGSELLEDDRIMAFSVPSVIVLKERNIVLNPTATSFHEHVKILNVEPFKLDSRFEK